MKKEKSRLEYDQLESKDFSLNKLLPLNIDEEPSKVDLSKMSLSVSPFKNLATSPEKVIIFNGKKHLIKNLERTPKSKNKHSNYYQKRHHGI